MTRRQRSPFGELVYANRTARNLTQAALAGQLATAQSGSNTSGSVSRRTISNIERQYSPDEPWSFNQQATVDILATLFGFAPGSPEWNEFQAAAHATRTFSFAARGNADVNAFVSAGRESQLERVNAALDQVAHGQHGVLLLAAEGGAGKTTMLLHACRLAIDRHSNLAVAWGESRINGNPYQPFVEMTGACIGLQEHANAEHIVSPRNRVRLQERLPAALASLRADGQVFVDRFVPIDTMHLDQVPVPVALTLNDLQSAGRIPTDEQEFLERTWHAAASFAQAGPLVLVFDNLHLADEGTVALLIHLVRRLQESSVPILVLGTYRPFDLVPAAGTPAPPFAHALTEITHQVYDPVVNLESAIGGDEGRAYIEALVASRVQEAPASLVGDILALTEGLPLFADAVLRWYQQGGTVQMVTPADPLSRDATKAPLPAEIREVVADLFARLPPRHQSMLQAASVQDTPFSADVLQQVLGVERATLIEDLANYLSRRANVVEVAGTSIIANQKSYDYRFYHSMVRDFVYRNLADEQRRTLHRTTAQAMIGLWGDDTHNGAPRVGRQFELAGDMAAAARWYLRAGDYHLFRHEHRQATPFYQRVQDLDVAGDEPFVVAQARVGLGNCARGLGDLPQAQELLTEAGEIARQHEVPLAQANALTSLGMVAFDRGQMSVASANLQRAIGILRNLGNQTEVCRSLALLAHALQRQGRFDDARRAADEAMSLATELDNDGLYVHALVSLVDCLLAMGDIERANTLARQGYANAEEHGDAHRMALCALNLAHGLIEQDDADGAAQVLDQVFALRRVINGRMAGTALFERGLQRLRQGDLEGAEQALTESIALRHRHHQHSLVIANQVVLLQVAIARGDSTAVRELAQDIRPALSQNPEGFEHPIDLCLTLIEAGEYLGDTALVTEATHAGQALLRKRAALLADGHERRRYLEAAGSHRFLLAATL